LEIHILKKFYLDFYNYNLLKAGSIPMKLAIKRNGDSENDLKALNSMFLKDLKIINVGSISLSLNHLTKYISRSY
jgi:hypothetical protein